MSRYCKMCGKRMNPVEVMLGTKCGKCVRKLHRAAVEGKQFDDKIKKKAGK